MIFLKSYFVTTTQEADCIPVIHDIRFAIRDSQMKEGVATVTIPSAEAFFVIAQNAIKENLPAPQRSLTLPFHNGELLLDPREIVFLVDQSDSGKRREFFVQVMGEKAAAAAPPASRPGRRR